MNKKPTFNRPPKDDFFKKLIKEVQENILKDKSIQPNSILRALLTSYLYSFFYGCLLYFGNSTPLLFTFYLLMAFSMIVIFVNSYHDAAHNAVFFAREQNRLFCYVLELFGSN